MDHVPPDQLSNATAFSPGTAVPEGSESPVMDAPMGRGSQQRWLRPTILGAILLALALVATIAATSLYRRLHPVASAYETTALRSGDLSVVVTVTGVLAPMNQVDVGSELSGTISSVEVEENDHVSKGQLLATLDTSRLSDQVAQAQAALASAEASLAQATATRWEASLKAGRLHRLFDGSSGGWPARADVDAADAALARSEAAVSGARAAIAQARATLRTARTNLSKAVIRSPVDGVVLTRKAEPGQTVAASLQAPVLFTLAEDMRQMELHADIDEADVGQVREGQTATFTVDAYPGRDFRARITRVGYGAQTKEGVVTYTGVLSVDNADLALRPGMTASADIRTLTRHNVLLAPEAALRFSPPEAETERSGLSGALLPRMPLFGAPRPRKSADASQQEIWFLEDGQPQARMVRIGASDGLQVEVSGSGLRPGMAAITRMAKASR